MASSIETTSTTTTLKNNGNTYLSVDTNDDVAITNTLTATSPTFVTPNIGAATVTSLNGGQLAGNRNKIINGDMKIDQRNAGAAVTPTDGLFSADRWRCGLNQASKFSIQQQSEAPVGFSSSLKITSLSAYSLAVGDLFLFEQRIEGFNFSDLAWGTASAKAVTLSFYVRSSLTGTFGGSVRNAANARSYPFNYTISSADTWEQKTVTIAGDTSGTWVTTNAHSATVGFGLGVGTNFTASAGSWVGSAELSADSSVSVVGTNAATFYITGVQLEVGSVATPFEHRSYGTELALCQRYAFPFRKDGGGNTSIGIGLITGTNTISFIHLQFPVRMRASPTLTVTDASSSTISEGAVDRTVSGQSISVTTKDHCDLSVTHAAGTTGAAVRYALTATVLLFESEL